MLLRRCDLIRMQRNLHLLLVVRVRTCLHHVLGIWSVILVATRVILNGSAPIEKLCSSVKKPMSTRPVMMLIQMVPMMMTLVMTGLMPILPPPTTFFARNVCLMCHLHLKVSSAICSKLKHFLDQTKLANSSSMVVVIATFLAKSCVQDEIEIHPTPASILYPVAQQKW
jgi:hypothetical protein